MHVATFIVCQWVLLQLGLNQFIGDSHLFGRGSANHQFQDVEQFAGVAPTVSQDGARFPQSDMTPLEFYVVMDGAVKQFQEVFFLQRLEYIQLTPRQQGADDLERGILGGGPDERDNAFFDSTQQRVLLRLAEPVNLVDEQNGRRGSEKAAVPGPFNHLAHVFHPAGNGAQRIERRLQHVGDDVSQGGFSHARRPPQDERRNSASLNHLAQHRALSHQVTLPHIFVERARAHSFCQRFTHNPLSSNAQARKASLDCKFKALCVHAKILKLS